MGAGSAAQPNRVAIVAGGTAGHILPSLEIALKLKEYGTEPYWLGDLKALKALEARATIPAFELKGRSPRSLRRLVQWSFYKDLFCDGRLLWPLLSRKNVGALLVTGGAIGFLPGLIALLRGVPVLIYEQNVVLGAANALLRRLGARQIFYGLPPMGEPGLYLGQPLRSDILSIKPSHQSFRLKKTLLVVGGSLGALTFNTKLARALAQLPALREWAIYHLAGPTADLQSVATAYEDHPDCHLLGYTDNMASLYQQADCVIARAGALTLSELHYQRLPAVLIPLPQAAGDHQRLNAQVMVKHGPFVILEEQDLTPAALEQMIYTSLELACNLPQQEPLLYHHAAQEIALQCLRLSQKQ